MSSRAYSTLAASMLSIISLCFISMLAHTLNERLLFKHVCISRYDQTCLSCITYQHTTITGTIPDMMSLSCCMNSKIMLIVVVSHLVVHLLRAVEHVHHDAQGSTQVLSGLSLAGTSWSCWGTTHGQVKGLSQCDVTPAINKTTSIKQPRKKLDVISF